MSHISQIQQRLDTLDALLLTDPISIRYASGFYITDGAALVTKDRAWLVTDSRYVEAASQAVPDMEVLSVSIEKPLYTLLRELTDTMGGGAIGTEETRLSHSAWNTLEERLGRTLTPAASILAQLRASKDAGELTQMIAAQRIAEKALDEVLGLIRPGLTEKQVAAELVYRMYKYGGEANSFDPIVITGKKTSMPHGVPGDEIIQDGDFVTMDFGTMYGGYCSDMTRTVAVGHATEEMKRVYATVLEAQLAGIAAAKPGMTGRDIDKAARDVIDRAGYGQYFGHSFGHSLGLEIHEAPNASPSNGEPMPEGAVISAEPGIYIPGQFGVRIEDVLWLREGGAENITKAPKSLIIL
jgi:Xaa-Pro aminopeptidase